MSKHIVVVLLLLLSSLLPFSLSFAQETGGAMPDFSFDLGEYITDRVCRVEMLNNAYFLVEVADESRRYAPLNLEESFKKEGLQVKVSGVVGKVPPNVRMIGTPFMVRTIDTIIPAINSGGTAAGSGIPAPTLETTAPTEAVANTRVEGLRGTVRKFNDIYVIETTDGDRYVPTNLPKKHQRMGRLLEFSGVLLPLPEQPKVLGRPIAVENVRRNMAL